MGVDECVMHANVGQSSAQAKSIDFQSAQKYFQIGAEECRITTFWNDIIARFESHLFLGYFGSGIAFQTVDIFAPVKLSTEINVVGAVDLLYENDRNALFVCLVDGGPHFAIIHERARLNVDYDQRRAPLDNRALGFGKVRQFISQF